MKQKLQYLWDYYKLPFFCICIILCVLLSILHRKLHPKETVLFLSFVNVTVGDSYIEKLTEDFLSAQNQNPSQKKISCATGLYLTEDTTAAEHEYTYASRMKILGSINARKMDIVLMNQEAFDTFAQNGYLCNLEQFFSENLQELSSSLTPYLVSNTHIIQDNATDVFLDKSITYQATTEEYPMGLTINSFSLLKDVKFSDTIYLGVIKNSPRQQMAAEYIAYLFSGNTQ